MTPAETDTLIFFGVCLVLTIVSYVGEYKQRRENKRKAEMMESAERRLHEHDRR